MAQDEGVVLQRKNRRLLYERSADSESLEPITGYAQGPTLSLTDACKPLVGIVDSILNYVSIALETAPDKPADGLTRDESASIRLYTMEWTDDNQSLYCILNQTLRTANRNQLRPWFKYLKLLLTALIKIPCAQSQTVWRGVRRNVSDDFPPGTEITWWAFSSCTTTLTVLENELYLGNTGKRTLFSIEVFNGRDISAHSYFKTEDEILLLPGTYMEVRSQLNPNVDMYIIHLRQMMPKKTLLEPPFHGARLYPKTKSSRHGWYRKKKLWIPISIFIVLCILAIILGSVFGRSSSTKTSASNEHDEPRIAGEKILLYTFVQVAAVTSTQRPTPGMCANARWSQVGVTVAGGNGMGEGLNQLNSPDGLFVEGDGTVYSVDSSNNRVIKWTNGASIGHVVAGGNGQGNSPAQLNYPVDVVVDGNGTMYISDYTNHRIHRWSPGATTGETILSDLTFTGIGLGNEGSLYTADWTNNQVVKWRKGTTVGKVLPFGTLDIPDRLYVDQNRTVYVVDRGNDVVLKVIEGATQSSVVAGGSGGAGLQRLDSPRGVTVDELGNVYVADTKNHRVTRWSPNAQSGTLIVGGQGAGSRLDQLDTPTDLQFDRYGNLYVADSGNNRVQKFVVDKSSC